MLSRLRLRRRFAPASPKQPGKREFVVEWGYLVLGIVIGLLLNPFISAISPTAQDFLDNMVPEAVGIIFTVLILERLDSLRQRRSVRDQLVRRAHSRDNRTALAAIEEMRVLGHLEDGSLAHQELRGSNWENANLYMADLRGTDLTNARLYKADFVKANLTGAIVSDEQLAATDIMFGATLPDGNRYDGRYNLPGDFAYARREKVDLKSPQAMAQWFGVTLEQYLRMQEWAKQNLVQFKQRSRSYDVNDPSNLIDVPADKDTSGPG